MKLTLYYAPLACSLVPVITLNEAGAEFEIRVVDFRSGAHMSTEYLRINPKHKVPVLDIDGEPLTENVAILQWIAHQFPDARLLPAGGAEFKAISLLAWCAAGIHPHLTPNVLPQRYCDLPGSEDSVRRCAQKLLFENYRIADELLTGQDWFFEHFTAADAYFFWCFRRGMQFKLDLTSFSNCAAHFARVLARPSVQRALDLEAETLASLERAKH